MTSGSFRHVGDRPIHDGYVWNVVVGDFVDPDGRAFTRDIVRSPGAVAVVALFDDHTTLLVRQYRAAFDAHVLEIPAGMRDVAGEDPEATARRELIEETGFDASTWRLLHRFFPSVGMTDAVLHVYLATELRPVGRSAHGPEEEHMEVVRIPIAEAIEMVETGQILDAKATIGLLMAARVLGDV
ncbi:MAG: NUDIX hydrolase [Actinomycetota bacterium]|nr:NUDIX hydrolase [Actinomycetota bacterium]MDA2972209.1 NUDIX hydrolase [Actinomycetota bacterium]MDA3001297.1 NUDIX hydrolase [Actinomycetota bacterium]